MTYVPDKPIHTLGDAPIEDAYREQMNMVAFALDEMFNGDAARPHKRLVEDKRKVGFILLVFPYGEKEGRCNYISNGANRDDVVVMLKEQIKRFEGQAEVKHELRNRDR
jgi:hypothetical protein